MTTNAQRFKNLIYPGEGNHISHELFDETFDIFQPELVQGLMATSPKGTAHAAVLTFSDSSAVLFLGVAAGAEPSHPEGFTTIHVEASKEALAPIYAGLATKYNLEIIKP